MPVAGAGSRRPGRGLRDPGSPRSGEERNKGCAARRSPSPRPNFARGAGAPGETARGAEDPGVGAEPGWGRPRAALSPTPGRRRESRSFPEAAGGRAACWDRASRGNSARFRGCPSPWPDHPALGVQGPAGRPLPPPSLRSRAKVDFCSPSSSSYPSPSPSFLPFLAPSEPSQGTHLIFFLLLPASSHASSSPSSWPPLLPGDSAEKGVQEGGMWVPL